MGISHVQGGSVDWLAQGTAHGHDRPSPQHALVAMVSGNGCRPTQRAMADARGTGTLGFAPPLLARDAVLLGRCVAVVLIMAVLASGLERPHMPASHRYRRNSRKFDGLFPAFLVLVGRHACPVAPSSIPSCSSGNFG